MPRTRRGPRGVVAVRDSRNPEGRAFRTTAAALAAFVGGRRRGAYQVLMERSRRNRRCFPRKPAHRGQPQSMPVCRTFLARTCGLLLEGK
ncbi:DUF397 domain-containing protein [Streptomyces sp. NBC_01351]|uniref:DUF397 domain-containing protein n=1 Tax=Streptomyces sp. NBC_01351 TaxID=2903833 RepID=UPI003FCD8E6F